MNVSYGTKDENSSVVSVDGPDDMMTTNTKRNLRSVFCVSLFVGLFIIARESNSLQAEVMVKGLASKEKCGGGDSPSLVNFGENPTCLLGRCNGDCDRDSDCAGGLLCFERDMGSYSIIPGCKGRKKQNWDYCYAKDLRPPCDWSDGITLTEIGANPNCILGRCQGDCDTDEHCADGLKCVQRDEDEPIPQCKGRNTYEGTGWDFCL